MKNKFNFAMVTLLLVFGLNIVAAADNTIVSGNVYYGSEPGNFVSGAAIEVTCNPDYESEMGTMSADTDNFKTTTTDSKGHYSVMFDNINCKLGDDVFVVAGKDGMSTTREGEVGNYSDSFDLAIVDIPMVPEFGTIVGMLTMISAIGIFFVVRKD